MDQRNILQAFINLLHKHTAISTDERYYFISYYDIMVIHSGFNFLTLVGVFVGIKNDSKNSGRTKKYSVFSQNFEKMDLFYSKSSKIL